MADPLNRANHYGSQPISSVRGLQDELDHKQPESPKLTAIDAAELLETPQQIPVFVSSDQVVMKKIGPNPNDLVDGNVLGEALVMVSGGRGLSVDVPSDFLAEAQRTGFVRPEWWGAKGDGTTDDTAAFVAMRTWLIANAWGASSGLQRSYGVLLGAKTYYLASSFDCKGFTAKWLGCGGGYDIWENTGATTILMASGATWYFQAANTEGNTTGTTIPFSCAGSEFHNITWQGPGKGVGTAYLAYMRATVYLYGCRFLLSGSHGLVIRGTIGGGTTAEGNVNVWLMVGGSCSQNGGDGLFTEGADANAGTCLGVSFNQNDGYGTEEESFLGNSYYGCHWNGNTLGHIKNTNPNNTSRFGDYFESGYPLSVISPRSVAFGTNATNQIDGASYGATDAAGTGKGFFAVNGLQVLKTASSKTYTRNSGIRPSTQPGTEESYTDFSAGGNTLYQGFVAGQDRWIIGINYNAVILASVNGNGSGGLARYTYGLGTAPSGVMGLKAFALGDTTSPDGRIIATGSAAPASGEHARGEIVFNNAPSAGGKVGWVCVTGGTPGTWKPFGAIDP